MVGKVKYYKNREQHALDFWGERRSRCLLHLLVRPVDHLGHVAPGPSVRCCWIAQLESDRTWSNRSVVSRGNTCAKEGLGFNLTPRPSIINLNPFLPLDPGMHLSHTLEIFWSTPPYTHMTGFLFLALPWLVSSFPIRLKWCKSWVRYSTWLYQHRCSGSL